MDYLIVRNKLLNKIKHCYIKSLEAQYTNNKKVNISKTKE